MSGNRKGNGNRQRNVSMTSNTSTSSFKDNSTLNQQRISQQQQLDLGSVTQLSNVSESHRRQRSTQSNNASSNREEPRNQQPNRAGPWTNSSPRPSSLFDSINFDFSEDRTEPPVNVIRAEMANDTTLYTPIDNRSRKLQEAQQRLLQLQELMQNVSLDLDCNPFGQQQQEDHKNNKPRRDVRDLSLDFLRNVPSTNSGYTRTTTSIPRVNPNVSRLSNQHYAGAQQNNLSHDSLSSPKRYPSQSQVNGSSHHLTMLDVFHPRSEPSFDDSSDDDANEDDDPIDADDDEEDNIPHALPNQLVNGETNSSTPRNTIRIPIEQLERIENQVDRTNSLCELLVVEQRRLAMVTESLLTAVSALQTNAHQAPPPTRAVYRGHPANFSMSRLPMNPSWNADGGGDYNVLAGAVGQCCLMLTQLQRELASAMDQTPPPVNRTTPGNENSAKARSSASCSYEMDRFEAATQSVTLNNRVPPGTRTNNYWDNFRSYSRQNLLSTAGPANNTAADLSFHAQTPGGGSSGSEQQQQLSSLGAHRAAMAALSLPIDETRLLHQQQQQQQQLVQPVRRTKRKVNKGQTTAHADNRQLAYGLLGVRNVNSDGAVFGSVAPDGAMGGAMGVVSSSDNNKVAKDTSTLKYSGARPKERRATPEQTQQQQSSFPPPPPIANVNLMAERKQSEDKTSLEAVVRGALSEVHSGRPQFVSQLLELLHKLDSEPLRQMALQALQNCVRDDQQQPPPPAVLPSLSPSELFSRMATNHRELTPNLLDSFLSAIQLPTSAVTCDELDQDVEEMEGAGAAGASLHHHQSVYLVRNALTPFLFRRLSDVHDVIVDTLAKLESSNTSSANRTADQSTASASGREDELAEADQSCDQSCDGTATEAMEMWNDNSNRIGPAVGLDEVPTRLMSVLQPPVWTSSPSRPTTAGLSVSPNVAIDETANSRNDWFPPTSDGGV